MVNKKSKKIFIIDDDQGILEVMKIILQEQGYLVEGAREGRLALAKIKKDKPDLVFVDFWMSGLDGGKIIQYLKEDPQTTKIPVIIVSALDETAKIAIQCQADNFLAKPFNMENLISLAKQYLG